MPRPQNCSTEICFSVNSVKHSNGRIMGTMSEKLNHVDLLIYLLTYLEITFDKKKINPVVKFCIGCILNIIPGQFGTNHTDNWI